MKVPTVLQLPKAENNYVFGRLTVLSLQWQKRTFLGYGIMKYLNLLRLPQFQDFDTSCPCAIVVKMKILESDCQLNK